VTAANNALLFNAAVAGAVGGHVRGRRLAAKNSGTPPAIGTPDPSYEAIAEECSALATEVDSLIPTDDVASPQPVGTQPISVSGTGVAIVPTTGAIQQGQLGKARLLEGLALAFFESRYYAQPSPLTSAQYEALAERLTETYLQQGAFGNTEIGLASISSATGFSNNAILAVGAWNGLAAGILMLNQGGLPDDQTILLTVALATWVAAFDAAVPADSSISTGGAVLTPSTSAIQAAQLGKNRLAMSIALAQVEQRSTFSLQQFGTSDVPNEAAIDAWAAATVPAAAACYSVLAPGIDDEPGTSPLNPALWNEAYCGFVTGILAGRPITSTSADDPFYTALGSAAAAFADAVDAAVGAADVSGNPVPTGTQYVTTDSEGELTVAQPANGTIQEGELGKTGVLWAICRGVNHGRPLLGNSLDATESTYAAEAQSVVALYLVVAEALTYPS
jgi:hypothetical protein